MSDEAALFEAHPGAYIGPLVLSATLQGFQTGLALNFAYRFWRDDLFVAHKWVHGIMLLVTALVLYAQRFSLSSFFLSLTVVYPA